MIIIDGKFLSCSVCCLVDSQPKHCPPTPNSAKDKKNTQLRCWAKESELNLTSKLYIFMVVLSIMLYFFKLYLLVQFILFLALAILALAVARAFFDTTSYESVYVKPGDTKKVIYS
ncbi:hypothetical protein [Sporomusa ovata]|uniref:hypothetical protein n=1 Tax=Sporomusa ovata TaxID=2378 RepID=UPI0030CC1C7B